LAARGGPDPETRALSWRGDRLSVFGDTVAEGGIPQNPPKTYLLWQIELDSEAQARALADMNLSPCIGAAAGPRVVISCDDSPSQAGSDLYGWGMSWLLER
jgi:hypothetical protein